MQDDTLSTPGGASSGFLGTLPVREHLRPKLPKRSLPPLPAHLARAILDVRQGSEWIVTDIAPEEAVALWVAGEA